MECLLAAAMSEISPIFRLLTLVLAMAVVVSLLLYRLRQSLLVGYFLCGILIANSPLLGWLGMSDAASVIGGLAELGVILLMFTLGVEFSFGELRHLWRGALAGGAAQVLLTLVPVAFLSYWLGLAWPDCFVVGLAAALSSTAVAMKSFQDLGQTNNPGARFALGVALFQDILVILIILALPSLYGGGRGGTPSGLLLALAKGCAFLAASWLAGRYLLSALLHAVARTKSRELFTLTVIGLCAGIALAGGALDLSLALGAFAAGLVVCESIYAHRIMADILPFKDLFLTIFFVSVGLQIDLNAITQEWPLVLGGTLGVLVLKTIIVLLIARGMGLAARPALLAAFSLSSMGEFSLVLTSAAGQFRPLDPAVRQLLLATSAIGMGLVPTLMRLSGRGISWMERLGWVKARPPRAPGGSLAHRIKGLTDHAVICGYGPVGRSLNEALRRCGVPTLLIELNADTVRELKDQGQPVLFADATHHETMSLAGIERARLVAFTFPNVEMTEKAVRLLRQRHAEVCIFGRAKFAPQAERLQALGVRVIHDERESALAMVSLALSAYDRPDVNPAEVVRAAIGP